MARLTRSVVLTGLLCAIGVALLVSLGVWQLHRLAWKENLIAMVNERTTLPPVPLPPESDWLALNRANDEYRPVVLSGRFDHAREMRVFTSLGDANLDTDRAGYWILTPLRLDDGSVVIVNRGFVPQSARDPATRPRGQVEGEARVVGLIRMPESGNLFTPAPEPDRGAWYARNPAEIAESYGIARVAPFFIDADATPNPGGLPEGGLTRVTFRNDHLGYAITWFGLALALAGVYAAWAWSQLRRPGGPPDGALADPARRQ